MSFNRRGGPDRRPDRFQRPDRDRGDRPDRPPRVLAQVPLGQFAGDPHGRRFAGPHDDIIVALDVPDVESLDWPAPLRASGITRLTPSST